MCAFFPTVPLAGAAAGGVFAEAAHASQEPDGEGSAELQAASRHKHAESYAKIIPAK